MTLSYIHSYRPLRCGTLALLLLALLPFPPMSSAQGQPAQQPEGALGDVSIETTASSIPADGDFAFDVAVNLIDPVDYLEIRFQLMQPNGRLVYQRTFVDNEAAAGAVRATFERELGDLSLRPGLYPIEVRVRLDDQGTTRERLLEDRLLVFDPQSTIMPFTLVVQVAGAPSTDAAGRFVVDPSRAGVSRDAIEAIAEFVIAEPRVRLSVAVPPMLLQEWMSASDGYESAGPEGVIDVPSDDPVAVAYARALDTLRRALATGRMELLDVPFADPEPAALHESGRSHDILDHLTRGASTYLATLGETPGTGIAPPGPCLPQDVVPLFARHGIEYMVVSADCLVSGEETPSTGAYLLEGTSDMSVLVTDAEAEDALAQGDTRALVDRLFTVSISSDTTPAASGVVEVGPGRRASAEAVIRSLSALAEEEWLDTSSSQGASSNATETIALRPMEPAGSLAPKNYWDEVNEARRYGEAFLQATGPNDADADVAVINSLLAQSRSWAGADNSWSLAERGLAFSSASLRESRARLDAVTLSARTMTLSSSSGLVPVSIMNGSDKALNVIVKAEPDGLALTDWRSKHIVLQTSENFLTIPVNLESSISGGVDVQVWAGDVMLDEEMIPVRASYLDRLAAIAGVSLALLAMLWFIRRRVRAAEADTVSEGE